MVWKKPINHSTDYYFYTIDVTRINRKNWRSLKYPGHQSTSYPVAHSNEIPAPIFGELPDISYKHSSSVQENKDKEIVLDNRAQYLFFQKELNDLVHNLSLSVLCQTIGI